MSEERRHLRPMNKRKLPTADVQLQSEQVMQALGCTTVFEPGWETDAYEGAAGLCRPFQRDIYGCSSDCWWPAQVPDELSNYGGWVAQCGNTEKDWANVTFIE
ncbi:MAG: quinohemoprotein amine dehydrogenase subunit gamma [Candidatus Sericytochromatia bacterium]|nr:quinohemoprotein amine dehydrogenase subunit gamma [Candidatus Sericytochromatia bacterium]